ncbi:holin [Clostridium tarantellae]|uniref:holin n=1 Tax=Clostridium tarantellae TaxID=39493 RepID=UPI001A9C096D|nr:holin [Clostridium tarantellae]
MKFDWSKLRNYGLWVSVIAFIPLALQGFGLNVLPNNYEEIATALLSILVLAGIIAAPLSKNKETKTNDENTKIHVTTIPEDVASKEDNTKNDK